MVAVCGVRCYKFPEKAVYKNVSLLESFLMVLMLLLLGAHVPKNRCENRQHYNDCV